MTRLTHELRAALRNGDAVIRIHANLAPAAGAKILPPTYAKDGAKGGMHNLTQPRADGSSEWVSVDSPASFANRVEAELHAAYPKLAPLRVQIGDTLLSTLQMPHRAFDATLRESTWDGIPWKDTAIADEISAATPDHAYALLNYDPAVILFGGWDSTRLGKRGQAAREAKYPAALSGEITATDVLPIHRAGSRIDPLGIEGTEASLVEHEDGRLEPYEATAHAALPIRGQQDTGAYPRRVKPAQVNLGNFPPSLAPKGVLVRGAIAFDGVLDLRRLNRYWFAPADDIEARLLLVLMGLFGVDAVLRRGLDLRRDCELVATQATVTLARFATEPEPLNLDGVAAALTAQIAALREHLAQPVTLSANAALRSLVGAVG